MRQVVSELDVSRLTSLNKQVRDQGTEEATSSSAQESHQVQNETDELDNDEPLVEPPRSSKQLSTKKEYRRRTSPGQGMCPALAAQAAAPKIHHLQLQLRVRASVQDRAHERAVEIVLVNADRGHVKDNDARDKEVEAT